MKDGRLPKILPRHRPTAPLSIQTFNRDSQRNNVITSLNEITVKIETYFLFIFLLTRLGIILFICIIAHDFTDNGNDAVSYANADWPSGIEVLVKNKE